MKIFKEKKYSILSKILKIGFVFMFIFALTMPFIFANADTSIVTTIDNPLGENGPKNIPDFIEKAIKVVLVVAVPLTVLAIIYTGFLFVEAQGNSEKLTKAKKSLLYVIIGAFFLLGAYVIANAISATVEDIKEGA
jgi:preprotein translocase subunit SecY